ncbi:hypothetical protein VHUM_02292 [Vanrija humicola]|uniref:FAD dependent oxidoreductase domain-containing protein n=1 Tax=Vanrija humicola TaxID=5417 RepID=A0A7D8V075_VANHU|nr:hypothetical protein VHUM_02292 [Vanrija humicola]
MADYDVAIVGAGIVGSLLASKLAPHARVLLLDRDVAGLPGSTGHAPGFVGQVNSIPALSEVARRSVALYTSTPGGFATAGGMEVALASPDPDVARAALADAAGLPHRLLSGAEARALAPTFVDERALAAVYFPTDGLANAKAIAKYGQDAARAAGATLLDADVSGISKNPDGYRIESSQGSFSVRHVVVATGVWGGQLVPSLQATAVSVAHPYGYSTKHATRSTLQPFVRWPGAHVYARDHGPRDGVGSYDHETVHYALQRVGGLDSAYGDWESRIAPAFNRALSLLPPKTAATFRSYRTPARGDVHAVAAGSVPYAFNGLFTVTPDALPLSGALDVPGPTGLWCAVGVWVTSAGGVTGVLADQILEALGKKEVDGVDAHLRKAFDPRRFDGRDDKELETAALGKYNDIYNKAEQKSRL